MCVSQKLLCSKYQNYRISLYSSSFLQVGWIFLCSCLSLLLPDKFKYDSCVVCEKLGPSWSMSLALLSDECMRLDDLGPFSLCRYRLELVYLTLVAWCPNGTDEPSYVW
ncbi:hypothetical protein AtNW77_Chr2g0236941 [Arabidopsis thaliana]